MDKYHVFAAYQLVNAFAALFNCYGKTLPYTASFTLYISLISFTVILITVSRRKSTVFSLMLMPEIGTFGNASIPASVLRLRNLH